MLSAIPTMSPVVPGELSITADKARIAEGEMIVFTINTKRLPRNVTINWVIEGTAVDVDFVIPKGSIVTNGGTVTVSLQTVADYTVEGEENFALVLYTQAGQRLVASDVIYIDDTSIPVPTGQIQFAARAAVHEFVVPAGVSSLCAVLVGAGGAASAAGRYHQSAYGYGTSGAGGGLRWINNLPVTPGETLLIQVGLGGTGGYYSVPGTGPGGKGGNSTITRKSTGEVLVYAEGGQGGTGSGQAIGGGGSALSPGNASPVGFIGGGNGGNAGPRGASTGSTGGAGGAGGYTGAGGQGGTSGSGRDGVGGGGGGGDDRWTGGGTGLLGQGANGLGGGRFQQPSYGRGGSAGGDGGNASTSVGGTGGNPGGGGSPCNLTSSGETASKPGGPGGPGAVRLIWGVGRAFPATKTGNL